MANLYNNLGKTYKAQGKLDEAIAAFEKAISVNPSDARAYYNLGIIYAERGDDGDAMTQYKQALHLARTNSNLQELIPEIEDRIKTLK